MPLISRDYNKEFKDTDDLEWGENMLIHLIMMFCIRI